MFGFGPILKVLESIARSVMLLAQYVAIIRDDVAYIKSRVPPAQPGPLNVTLLEGGEAMAIGFDVTLPTLVEPHDVVSRELAVVVDGGAPDVKTANPGDVSVAGFSVPQGSSVELSLVDIDDAGNRSGASMLSFTADDTVPPPTPGVLTVVTTGETL